MSHYAKIDTNGKVINVIVAEEDYISTRPGEWVQTSYNTHGGVYYEPNTQPRIPSINQSKALRKNFAGIGFSYDSTRDAFIPPKPYDSWVLNEETCVWEAPTLVPTTPKKWVWDEDTISWKEFIKE